MNHLLLFTNKIEWLGEPLIKLHIIIPILAKSWNRVCRPRYLKKKEIFFETPQEVPHRPKLSLLSWLWIWAGREQEGRAVQSNSQPEQYNPTAHWSIQITRLKPLILLPQRKKDRQTESKKEKREEERFIRRAITIEICQRRDLGSRMEGWAEKNGG